MKKKLLYDLLKEEVTILVSTAYLDEAERCTRVGLIHRGKILMEDNPEKIKKSLGLPMIEVWSEFRNSHINCCKVTARCKPDSVKSLLTSLFQSEELYPSLAKRG